MKRIIFILAAFFSVINISPAQIQIWSVSLMNPGVYTTEVCQSVPLNLSVLNYNPAYTYVWKCYVSACSSSTVITVPSMIQNGTSGITVTASGRYFVEAYDAFNNLVDMSQLLQGGHVFNVNENGGICATGTNLCNYEGIQLRLLEAPTWVQFSMYGGVINWQLNNVDIPGATLDNYYPTQPGSYRCRLTGSCGTGYTNAINITSSGTLTPVISGNNVICSGNTMQLSVNAYFNHSYLWNTGATTSSITISTAGTYQVTVTNGNGCTGTASKTITSQTPQAPTISAAGPTSFCQGGSVVLNASNYSSSYITRAWKRNGTTVSNNSSYTATTSGTYTFSVTNVCGTYTSNSITVNANATSAITPTLTANGPTVRCITMGNVILTASPSGPGYIYQWYSNGVAVGGPTSNNTLGTGATSAISVAVSGNCVSGMSAAMQITFMSAAPPKPQAITGPAQVCNYQQGIVYSVAPVSNATGYNWSVPAGASIVGGQGTTSITVNWGNKFGNVTVQSFNPCGTSGPTNKKITKLGGCRIANFDEPDAVVLAVFPNPAYDVIQVQFSTEKVEAYTLEFMDISGKLLKKFSGISAEGINEQKISITELPAGMYFVFLKKDSGAQVQKLIVD